MAVTSGQISKSSITTNLDMFDVSQTIFDLDKDAAPFLNILSKLGNGAVAYNTRIDWFSTPEQPKHVILSQNYDGDDTSILLDHPEYLVSGSVIVNQRTKEQIYVSTAATSGATTISRGTPAYAMLQGDILSIMGTAKTEGAAIGTGKHLDEEQKWNYLQIFEEPVNITKTAAAVRLETGGTMLDRLNYEAGQRMLRKMEYSFIYGKRALVASNTVRIMGGISEFITTNVFDVGGVLVEDYFNEKMIPSFAFGESTKVCLTSDLVIGKMSGWAKDSVRIEPGLSQKYGINISEYFTRNGKRLLLVPHKGLTGPTRTSWDGFAGDMFILDMNCFRKRFLNTRDLKFTQNLPTSSDLIQNQWLGEIGMDRVNEEKCAKFTGITG